MMKRMSLVGILMATIIVLTISTTANAIPLIRLTGIPDSGPTVTTFITDDDLDPLGAVPAGTSSDIWKPLPGKVGFTGMFSGGSSGWMITVSSHGTTKPINGSATLPDMHLSLEATNIGITGSLIVEFLDNDFMAPLSNGLTMQSGGVGGGSGASILYESYYSTLNTQWPGDASLTLLNSLSGFTTASVSTPTPVALMSPGTYTLMQKLTLTHSKTGLTSSLDARLVTPEPGTVVLLGLGLLGLGVYGRKRRNS